MTLMRCRLALLGYRQQLECPLGPAGLGDENNQNCSVVETLLQRKFRFM